MKVSINAVNSTMYIKSEIMDTNDQEKDRNQASSDKYLEPSTKDVSECNNISVKEEFPKPIVKSEIGCEDKIDENIVIKQENNAENQDFKSDDVNNPADDTDLVKNKTKIEDPETVTDSCDAKPETTDKEEKCNSNKNTNKLVKRKRPKTRSRPSKRARMSAKQEAHTRAVTKDVEAENNTSNETSSNDIEYCLTVTNLPNSWSFMDIKNYIDMQCGPVDEIEMLKHDKTGNGAIKLSYQTKDECDQAKKKLDGKEIEGTKLTVSMSVEVLSDGENTVGTPSPGTSNAYEGDTTISKTWRPDLDIWEIDPKGTYGLKESFLKTLSITPPLDKWVHVSNFRCDKTDLRDVLEMAGNVIMCSVFNAPLKYANVMYSHPLEAVQAVSMLNGHNLYGQPLKVVMERSPVNTVLLAKGLTDVGAGLGANGKPLRNITKHYQRYVTNQSASLNLNAFEAVTPNGNLVTDEEFQVKKVDDFSYDVPKSDKKVTANIVTEGKSHVDPPIKSPESKVESKPTAPKFNVAQVQTPTRSPMRQQVPPIFQPRNGPNFSPFGPRAGPVWSHGSDPRMQRPFGPGPGPRLGWNGPGPMGPMSGPMSGPRPMGPMGGPMQGTMPRPMQGPMQGPMHRHMQGPMHGAMQGPMQGAMQGPMQGSMQGPMQGAMQGPMQGAMQGPMQGAMQGPMHRPMQGPMQLTGNMQGPDYNPNQPVQLHLSNLPPSTTFALLCEKMAACGQVVSIQLATPGSAVVTFANRNQADQCFQSYHNACVEGCMIHVKYT